MKFWIIVIILIKYSYANSDPTPIVLWHANTCCVDDVYTVVNSYKALLEKTIPGVYVVSIDVGNETVEDVYNTFFMETNSQIEYACKTIEEDPNLENGFNAIGFSQGGQFLRAVIQRCGHKIGRVKNLITLGSQHQGVYGNLLCSALVAKSCEHIRKLIYSAPYETWVQREIVLATYWHDPLNEEVYKKSSLFLSDINNELSINQTYIDNLNKLEHFVMIMLDRDRVTQPRESSWFGFYKPGQYTVLQTLQESDLYKKDRLGLKEMDAAGKLIFHSIPVGYYKFSRWMINWFVKDIVKVYLSPPSPQ